MSDTTKPEWSEYDLMGNKLPYTLTEGVVAAREGLYFRGASDAKLCIILLDDPYDGKHGDHWLSWSDVAKRLRYREGEPWATVSDRDDDMPVACGYGDPREWGGTDAKYTLHRLAAILCDDAEGFRVLHWCIEEFGDE